MGLFGSLFGSKNKTKSSNEPWATARNNITGEGGATGIIPEAERIYEQGAWNPNMQAGSDFYGNVLAGRYNSPYFNQVNNVGIKAMTGGFDPKITRAADISPQSVDLTQARAGQGVLDPTNAMRQMLSGIPNNPYLDQQAGAITNMLTRNVNENVMPGIRSSAIAGGQYGGSRQGIAEGLATSRLNQDLAPALTNLYGGAYENAQGRMFGTASGLNQQAENVATGNVDRDFQSQQFNANLGLQNNAQEMQRAQQSLNARGAGLGLLSQGMNMQDTLYDQYQSLQQQPSQYGWQNLNNYAGTMIPIAQLGGTSKSTQTSQPGIVPAALGTLSGLAGLASGMGGMSGLSGMMAGKSAGGFSQAARGFMSGDAPMFSRPY